MQAFRQSYIAGLRHAGDSVMIYPSEIHQSLLQSALYGRFVFIRQEALL